MGRTRRGIVTGRKTEKRVIEINSSDRGIITVKTMT